MKLTDLVSAAKSRTPHFELEIDTPDGKTVDVVFRNLIVVPEETRQEMGVASARIAAAKGKATAIRREAEIAKALLSAVVEDPEHILLLEDIFSADKDTRDYSWITLGDAYGKETQLGEAETSQTH